MYMYKAHMYMYIGMNYDCTCIGMNLSMYLCYWQRGQLDSTIIGCVLIQTTSKVCHRVNMSIVVWILSWNIGYTPIIRSGCK